MCVGVYVCLCLLQAAQTYIKKGEAGNQQDSMQSTAGQKLERDVSESTLEGGSSGSRWGTPSLSLPGGCQGCAILVSLVVPPVGHTIVMIRFNNNNQQVNQGI